jgi:transposase-like protein
MIETDFPETLLEFQVTFGTEEQCRAYLERQKWPNGFRCPRCGCNKSWYVASRQLRVCADCQHHCSLTAGTAFQGTRKPLRAWFCAMYLVTSSKAGLSAKELQRHLGCSYQTAWTWLHKLRAGMIVPDREPLSGDVELDETYIGGPEQGPRGRGAGKKTVLACAVEKDGEGTGRVRLGLIENASKEKLNAFLTGHVEAGSCAHTDGWRGYGDLERSGYRHILTVIDGSGMKAHSLLPRVHRVFSLIKRWVLGTHQGSVSSKHLPAYLEEFTFRFNRRKAKNRTLLFQRLIQGTVLSKCRPYWQIVGRKVAQEPLALAA